MIGKQRSFSVSHHYAIKDFQQACNFIAQHKLELKSLQSERNNRKSQSPRKINILCDSPCCTSTGPSLYAIQKLEADWKEFKESTIGSDKNTNRRGMSFRNRNYKNGTAEIKCASQQKPNKISLEIEDIDAIQTARPFNTTRQTVKHCVPITRISLQEQAKLKKSSCKSDTKLDQYVQRKTNKEVKLEDITNNEKNSFKIKGTSHNTKQLFSEVKRIKR